MTEEQHQEEEESRQRRENLQRRIESEIRDAGFDVVEWGDGKPKRQGRTDGDDGNTEDNTGA